MGARSHLYGDGRTVSRASIDPDRIEAAKALTPLSDIVGRVVRLKQKGRVYWACCPFHDERHASFRVDDWHGNWKCWGCDAQGDVIDFLKLTKGLSFIDALRELEGGHTPSSIDLTKARERNDARRQAELKRRAFCSNLGREIFASARPIAGTPGEAYFRLERKITLPTLPETLRFIDRTPHPDGGALPAIVGAWQAPGDKPEGGRVTGIWRIFLDPRSIRDGHPRKAARSTDKAGLGETLGNGGAVRLSRAGAVLGTAEGIETSLAVMSAYPELSFWAGCARIGLERLVFPDACEELWIFADRDPVNLAPGPSFGQRPGEESADILRRRALAAGIRVKLIVPPGHKADFNDYLGRPADE